MGAFQRDEVRFICRGLSLNAPLDAMPDGKFPVVQNVRTYQQGVMASRPGLTLLSNGALGSGLIHTINRLNDPTPFGAATQWKVFGAGVKILAGATTFPQIDTGYSGNPLTLVTAQPLQSPDPWMFVGDSTRQRKFDVNGHLFPIGIAPPTTEPSLVMGGLSTTFLQDLGVAPLWVAAGVYASAPTQIFKINTTISQIIYDSGTNGNASVAPASFAGITVDTIATFNANETLPIQKIAVAVATTTIAAIIYDSGTSGLCTIQPTASLGTGQLEGPDPNIAKTFGGDYAVPRGTAGTPPVPDLTGLASTRIRQIDFPVDCLITLGGAGETVRILSVAVGNDGIQSFRCSTANTHNAGDSITGVASFRINSVSTYAGGQTIQSSALQNVITPPLSGNPPAPPPQTIGGVQTPNGWVIVNNWQSVAGTGTRPDDDIHLTIRASDCTVVQAIRLYLDIDASVNNFTQNYFFFEWRANDIIDAIQNANAEQTPLTLQAVRSTTVQNAQLNQNQQAQPRNRSATGQPIASTATSAALALGNNQWFTLTCKVRDLIQVGTDTSRTLGNILAAEILVDITGANPITVGYSSVFLTGGFGPDVGRTGLPVSYAFRYRSSITGARSNPSPASRVHTMPRRQQNTATGTQSADAQVDLVDWFRIGGVLDRMTFAGTTTNANPPVFTDSVTDSAISGGESLDYTIFQPWATTDKARTGTCNVAGTAVKQVSGDTFNTSWAPGSPIIINGKVATLQSQPISTTLLFVNENLGSGTGVSFTLPEPTLLGQQLYGLWGPAFGTLFACGDPNNPGFLYWSFGNDPDRTSDAFSVSVTSGSEKLQNGYIWDDRPFVASTEQVYALVQDPSTLNWQTQITPCGKGFWTPWAYCVAPEGTYFLARDGIYLTQGGNTAQSITDADLYPLFPHDGQPAPVAVFGVNPPDMTQTNRLRLSYVTNWVYFDYIDTQGLNRTLAFRTTDSSWWFDVYSPGVGSRYSQTGAQVLQELVGGTDGTVYVPGGFQDNAATILSILTLVANQKDPRMMKLYRDVAIDMDAGGGAVTVTLSTSNALVNLGSTNIGGVSPRAMYPIGIIPALGAYGTNIQIQMAWAPVSLGFPALYLADIAFQNEVETTTSWLSGPTTHGFKGYQEVSAFYAAYISTTPIVLTIIIDGVQYSYNFPSSNNAYAKVFEWLQTVKGQTFQYGFQAPQPFMLFDKDCEAWVQPWGQEGGYQKVSPF